jgi:hypothetical protein
LFLIDPIPDWLTDYSANQPTKQPKHH